MRPDSPHHCPECLTPLDLHALSFYVPRTCPACGWGLSDAREQGRRDLTGTLALAAGSAGMVVLGIVGLLFGSIEAELLGVIGIAGLILAVDRSLQAWEFLRQLGGNRGEQEDRVEGLPGWCPQELAQPSPRRVDRRVGFERPFQAMARMSVGVTALAAMAYVLPVAPWERRALIGFMAAGIMLLAVRPLRITLEDWRHRRLAAHGRPVLGNVLKIEQPWYGGRCLRYRYLDNDGLPHEGRVWHAAPPADLPEGSAITVLYRRGEPSVSVPYPAARFEVTRPRAEQRSDRAG